MFLALCSISVGRTGCPLLGADSGRASHGVANEGTFGKEQGTNDQIRKSPASAFQLSTTKGWRRLLRLVRVRTWGLPRSDTGHWGAHLEGCLGPASECLLLATELITLAQLQQSLPTQLLQPCVHRSSKGTEVRVRAGTQPKHTEPAVQGAVAGHCPPPHASPCLPR